MSIRIRKAAVVGAGTMGSGIAALLAGVGVPVTLLDIPAPDSAPGDAPSKRNALALRGLDRLTKSRPPELFRAEDVAHIRVGNTEDDLERLADVDWVVEVVVEKLDVKRALFARLAEAVRPDTILSTNTSGLPIRAIAEGMGTDFTRRFLGTHFFNPPRYLRLLEVIPHPDTDPALVEAFVRFAEARLGKGVVVAKDEPNFIGNRFMSVTSSQAIAYAIQHGLSVEAVDSLTGPLVGRPKTGTFRLSDLVGNDVAAYVSQNLYPAIPDDPQREVLADPAVTRVFDALLERKWLGNKSGVGFYKTVTENGEKQFWPLDLATLDHVAPAKVRFDSVGKHRKVEDTGERIRLLMAEDDEAGRFLFHHFAFYLAYASHRVPEITDSIVNVDNAQMWGFAHEMGPFAIWDGLGVADTVPQFEQAGYPVADWVKTMVADGHTTFYQRNDGGRPIGYYSPQERGYVPLELPARAVRAADLRADNRVVKSNNGASIHDMGDGVALLEMHTPNSTLDADFIEMGFHALEMLGHQFEALVIGHDAERFCIGANLLLVLMAAQSGDLPQVDRMARGLQDFTVAARTAAGPVVTAPFNVALGGGTELLMGSAATVAHMELYAGLVEFGVGVIPAGSGTTALVRRLVNPVMQTKNADPLPHIQKLFEQVAYAKVSGSAEEARAMGLLRPTDRIVMNRAHLLGEARRTARYLADDYVPAARDKVYAAGRDVYAALRAAIDGLRWGRYASDHDAFIAERFAYVLTGGMISEPGWVDEQVMLDLEREVFVELVAHEKTQARIMHMLQTNKPLRN